MLEHIASYLLQRQDVPEALNVYRRAIEVAGPVMDLARLANIHHGLASGLVRVGQARQAIVYFERAVQISGILHDMRESTTANLARIENDFGDLLVREGRWERAEEMIQASLDHFAAAGIESGRAAAMLTMGDLKHCQGLLPEAIRWTSDAIALAERLGELLRQAIGHQQLGELWAAQGDTARFEASFARAFDLLDLLDLPERRARAVERYHLAREGRSDSGQIG
jgi:tetratricopeptide (TPR) repeat protein